MADGAAVQRLPLDDALAPRRPVPGGQRAPRDAHRNEELLLDHHGHEDLEGRQCGQRRRLRLTQQGFEIGYAVGSALRVWEGGTERGALCYWFVFVTRLKNQPVLL